MDRNPRVLVCLLATAAVLSSAGIAQAAVAVRNLHVEYRTTPLGIDVEKPRFGWQMTAPEGKRGYAQTAYRIVVTDPEGDVVWDTKKSPGARALGIVYGGTPLRPSTRYRWTVTVWDQTGAPAAGRSWFETGLMDPTPDSSAWSGATWIGGGDEDLVLYSHYLSIFHVRYAQTIAPGSTRASFVYGANDSRLMDANKNLFQLAAAKDQSYIKLELDVSSVDGSERGKARFNVYRVGYTETCASSSSTTRRWPPMPTTWRRRSTPRPGSVPTPSSVTGSVPRTTSSAPPSWPPPITPSISTS